MKLDFIDFGLKPGEEYISLPDVKGDWEIWKKVEFEELGPISLEYSEKLRSLAIVDLLTLGSSRLFREDLAESGRTRVAYLERSIEEDALDDFHRASGLYEPLLDTIAAGDLVLARHIAELSPREHRPEREHQEDYCYAQILHRLVQSAPPVQEISPLLLELESSLEERPKMRLDLCRALAEQDQSLFDRAFSMFLDAWSNQVGEYVPWDHKEFSSRVKKRRAEIADIGELSSNADADLHQMLEQAHDQVCIEALAILKLAEHRDLATRQDYPYCPPEARANIRTAGTSAKD